MNVENKENKGGLAIAKTLLVLCVIYMIGFYILKFIFPEYLLLIITDDNVLKFGAFIESSTTILHIYQVVSSFISFYLFTCASKGSFKLKRIEFWYILIAVVLCKAVNMFIPELYVHTSTSCMFLLSLLSKGKLGYTTITFVTHGFLSQFLTQIRGFGSIVFKINVATAFVLTIECWIWLVLFSLIFYLTEKRNGRICTTIHQ